MKEKIKTLLDKDNELFLALMEAIWIMRWTDNKEALYAVLEVEEAQEMAVNILKELDKAGYILIKKDEKK